MDRLTELMQEAVTLCEAKGVPFLVAYAVGSTVHVVDFQPADTPERLRKTFTAVMAGVKQTKHIIEIQA